MNSVHDLLFCGVKIFLNLHACDSVLARWVQPQVYACIERCFALSVVSFLLHASYSH